MNVALGSILYIQEFWEPDYHFCKLLIMGRITEGELIIAIKVPGEDWLVDARFFSLQELQDLTDFPEILNHQFWKDWTSGNLTTKYLGKEQFHF